MTDTLTPGSKCLLPVTFHGFSTRPEFAPNTHAFVALNGVRWVSIPPPEVSALIPASRLTDLEAEVARLREALQPFADAAEHLHPAQPDDGLTLDGLKVSEWRAAWSALNPQMEDK
jgi:hypothetical protein